MRFGLVVDDASDNSKEEMSTSKKINKTNKGRIAAGDDNKRMARNDRATVSPLMGREKLGRGFQIVSGDSLSLSFTTGA